jgi:hypothetical protein
MNLHLERRLRKTIRFHNSRTSLTSSGKRKVRKIAKILQVHPEIHVTVVGLSTARGYFGKRLTKGRAETTIKYLKKLGVRNKLKGRGVSGSKVYGIRMHTSGGTPTIPAGCTKKEEYLCVKKVKKAKTMDIITTRLRMAKKPNDEDVTKFVSWAAKEVTQEMEEPTTHEAAHEAAAAVHAKAVAAGRQAKAVAAKQVKTLAAKEAKVLAAKEAKILAAKDAKALAASEAAAENEKVVAATQAKALAAKEAAEAERTKALAAQQVRALAAKQAKALAAAQAKALAAKQAKALAAKQAAEAEHLTEIAQEGLHMAHKDAVIASQASSFRSTKSHEFAKAVQSVKQQAAASRNKMQQVQSSMEAQAAETIEVASAQKHIANAAIEVAAAQKQAAISAAAKRQADRQAASSDAAYANSILSVAHQGVASMHIVRKGLQAEAAVQQSIDHAEIRDVHKKFRKARAVDLLARSSMEPVAQPKKVQPKRIQAEKAQPLLVSPVVQPAALTTASMDVQSKATAFASVEKNAKQQAFLAGQKKEESYMKSMAKLQAIKRQEKAMEDKITKQYGATAPAAAQPKPHYRTRSDLAVEAIKDREKAAKLRLKASYGMTSGNLSTARKQQKQQARLTATSIQDQERATKLRTAQAFGIGHENAQKSQAAGLTASSIRDSERDGKSRISKAFGGVPDFGDVRVNPNGSLQTTQQTQTQKAKQAYSKYLASQEVTQKKFADALSESKATQQSLTKQAAPKKH